MNPFIIISLLFLSIGFSQLTDRQLWEERKKEDYEILRDNIRNIGKNREYNSNDLIEMDNGLWTEKFSDIPITGKVYGYFGEKRPYKKVHMGNIRNGKKEGKWVLYYHSTGRKMYEYNFKDGKKNGLSTEWYMNGHKSDKMTFKDGKQDGLHIKWYGNGQKYNEENYKDGKVISSKTWNKDGKVTSSKEWNEDGSVKE